MTSITVPYGSGFQTAECPAGIEVQLVDSPHGEPPPPIAELLEAAIDSPIGSPPLEELAKNKKSVAIVINDQTRPGPTKEMLDVLLSRLKACDISDDQISLVVATGTHRAPTNEELVHMIGDDYFRRFKVVCHDCQNEDELVFIGTTQSGLKVSINKTVADADLRITTGLIAPHHCAGYSGGCKSIVPGVSSLETLRKHHSFPIYPYEPAMGWFHDNPFHETALEAARMAGVDFIVNAVQNCHKEFVAVVAGDLDAAHEAGVDICYANSKIYIEKYANVIVSSPGGFPRDIDLYQSQKAVSVAEPVSTAGSIFILCAEANDGFGEGEFKSWMQETQSPAEIISRFEKEGFTVGSNKAFLYARALEKGEVIIVTDKIDPNELRKAKLGWAATLQDALNYAIEKNKPDVVTVIPYANNYVLKVKDKEKRILQ